MSDSIREKIIKAVYEHASQLTAREVVRCKRWDKPSTEPFITVWDGQSTFVNRQYGSEYKSFQIGIESSWISDSKLSYSEEVNDAMAKIEYHMGQLDLTGLATKFEWQSSQPFYPDTGEKVSGVRVTFDVQFAHSINNPYLSVN